jgi:DNA-binding MurR/RpiR family transcriptional regulator
MQKVLEALFQITPGLSPKLKNVAKLILDRPNTVATTSMRALAKQAGVTPPTMIRLANELGFENYESFREVFQKSVNDQKFETSNSWMQFENRASWLQQSSEAGGVASIVNDLAESGHNNIQDFYQNIDLEAVCKAADLIINAPTVYVVASGAAHWMAAYLQYVGNMALPHLRVPRTSGHGLVEGLIPIKKNDVILTMSYSPYAKQGIVASRFALARGARMVYLTDSKAAPLASEAEVLLLQKTDSPQFYPSMVSVVSAIETLIAVVVARSGERAVRAIADYAEIRNNDEYLL